MDAVLAAVGLDHDPARRESGVDIPVVVVVADVRADGREVGIGAPGDVIVLIVRPVDVVVAADHEALSRERLDAIVQAAPAVEGEAEIVGHRRAALQALLVVVGDHDQVVGAETDIDLPVALPVADVGAQDHAARIRREGDPVVARSAGVHLVA